MTRGNGQAKCRAWRMGVVVAVLVAPAGARAAEVVAVDPAARYQTWDGWGASLCWWANVIGGWEDAKRQAVADLVFGRDKGLGLTVARYNIGGGDAPGHSHLRPGGAVPGYRPGRDKPYDWSADANQRWMLRAAIRRGVTVTEAWSNSPPWWMTVSGCVAGSKEGKANNLRDDSYEAFADYLATVVGHFRTHWGVTFTTLDPMNEPGGWWWKAGKGQEGCYLDRAGQMRLIRAVAAAMKKRGLAGTRISAMDTNWVDAAAATFEAYDKPTRALVAQLNTHSYGGTRRAEVRNVAGRYGKRLHMSEFGLGSGSVGHDHASMTPALELAGRIVLDLRDLQPRAWVLWQPVENEQYCIWWKYNYGLIHADLMHGKWTWAVTKKYHGFGQFTRFIRPGQQQVAIGADDAVAFVDWKAGRLVIVSVNAADKARPRRFDLSRFSAVGTKVEVHRTSDGEDLRRLADVTATRAGFAAREKARSITTYVLGGVAHAAPLRKINDTDQAGPNRFEFVGTWSFTGREANAYTRDNHWGWKAGDYYLVRFHGRQVKLYGAKAPSGGIAAVSVDGGPEKMVDLYKPRREDQALFYASPLLRPGAHVVKVRVTGRKNAKATHAVVSADRADVIGG